MNSANSNFEKIRNTVEKKLVGSNLEVRAEVVTKNGVDNYGIGVAPKDNNSKKSVVAIHYVNQLMEKMEQEVVSESEFEESIEKLVADIVNKRMERSELLSSVKMVEDKDFVMEHVEMQIVKAGNENKQALFVPFLDLSIQFRVVLEKGEYECMSAVVTQSLAKQLELSVVELLAHAKKNIHENIQVNNIVDIIGNMLGDEMPNELEDAEPKMYVLTNTEKVNGAGAMTDGVYLQNLAEKMECDFFILPSSIHEVLLIPFKYTTQIKYEEDRNQYFNMVQGVNEGLRITNAEDVLCDNVYVYRRGNGQVEIA